MGELHKQLLQLNFYPRPPRGGRHAHISIPAPFAQFLSTPSARRATAAGCFDGTDKTYFYPRPPRGGRLCCLLLEFSGFRFLSTPSARRATAGIQFFAVSDTISIHALREEGDEREVKPYERQYISIHALREEGDLLAEIVKPVELISIHALREEGDIWI